MNAQYRVTTFGSTENNMYRREACSFLDTWFVLNLVTLKVNELSPILPSMRLSTYIRHLAQRKIRTSLFF